MLKHVVAGNQSCVPKDAFLKERDLSA